MQALNEHIAKDGFRLRGTQMSRIDGFSDVPRPVPPRRTDTPCRTKCDRKVSQAS